MSSKSNALLVLILFLGGMTAATAQPPSECTPEPTDPDNDGKHCPLGEVRPPPTPPPLAPEGLALVQRLSAQLLERLSPGRGREGR